LGDGLFVCTEWQWAWLGDRARGCSWCDIQNTQSVTKRLCSKRNAVYLQAVSGWHKHSCFSGSDERLGPHLWQPVPPMMASVRLLGCKKCVKKLVSVKWYGATTTILMLNRSW